ELWEGPRAGVEGAKTLTGVDTTGFIDDFQIFFENFVGKFNKNNLHIYYDVSNLNSVNIKPSYKNLLSNRGDFTIVSPLKFVHELRWRKSPAEIKLLRKSCDIAARGFVETMRFCYADVDENHLSGKFDFECKINGAKGLAYPPVVAGGNRANTIHYLNADQLIRENELVLMDAGCDFGGYSSDITRCWPVSGKFNAAQKEVYEVLLKVQVDLIQYLENTRPVSLRDFYTTMIDLLTIGLSELGLFTNESLDARRCLADSFCPHHVSHYLGLDVHDTETVSKTRPLESGVVVTVEPGLYFNNNDKRIPEKFRGIGLRIEDDILITESGVEVLSARTPKDVATIEEIMKL
uniref:Peptidase M24 domain-containing protein n=1 Tax=Romanomermis culicivorax TaxID=13658 RepID=A0A915JXX1_ROMCU